MQAATVSNNQLLPPEVSASSGTWFGRARSYPIFSLAWYRYRSLSLLTGSALVFLVLLAMLGAPMVNAPAVAIDWSTVGIMAGLIVLPFCMLCLLGPGMAVALRRLNMRRSVEMAAILLALLLGMALSGSTLDMFVQMYEHPSFDKSKNAVVARTLPTISINVQAHAGQTQVNGALQAPAPQDPLSKELGKLATALVGMAAMLLACWLGGLFDLVAFIRQRGKLVDVLQKEELKRAQAARNSAEMRLSVLAAQVEPHFLFNTLASVRSAIGSDPQRATQIVDHMVGFLRSTIPQMRDDAASGTVRLSTQMDSARSYLALMHERITRLQFAIDLEPGLENASMPPLMLISLVENAVKHGVEPKIGPARIEVRARRIDTPEPLLEVCVNDDGVGFGDSASGDGIGLANIQERLRSYYGQRASLTLKALPDGGVAAILSLPLSFEP